MEHPKVEEAQELKGVPCGDAQSSEALAWDKGYDVGFRDAAEAARKMNSQEWQQAYAKGYSAGFLDGKGLDNTVL
jgi:hypothetical protein